jgi:DNA-binding CsgD family transcriptional regulator
MFQDRKNRSSGRSAEQNMNKTDNPNYEADTHNLGFKESQQMAIRPDKSRLTRSIVFRVRAIAKAGGNPMNLIKWVGNSDDQMTLLNAKWLKQGLDRPCVRPTHFTTNQERADIIANYAAQKPVADIAKTFHVCESTVYRIATEVISRKPTEQTNETKEHILKMYDEGLSCNKIGLILNLSHQYTRRIVLEAHPEMPALSNRKFVRLTEKDTAEVLRLFNNGMIIARIAAVTNHSKSTIERIVGHIPSRSYKKNDGETLEILHTAWTLGEGLGATARRLNMAKSTVKFHFDKFKKDQK